MGYAFHKDKLRYFEMQRENAANFVIPFIEAKVKLKPEMTVLEIGCAEGGVLKAFLEKGLKGTGVELSPTRAEMARDFLDDYIQKGQAEIIAQDIYDVDFGDKYLSSFDIIVLKDVIEHIHDQPKLIAKMKTFLRPGGHIFFGFPPWMMPFGGHQQICKSKWARKLPWYHILPKSLYRGILKLFKESDKTIEDLMEIKDTRITLEQFERYVKEAGYTIAKKTLYLVNPIYKYKFGWKPREQSNFIGSIPWFRNFVTTCGYYLIRTDK